MKYAWLLLLFTGLTLSRDGQLIACEHGDRRVSIMPLSRGGKKTLADNHKKNRFNSPNADSTDEKMLYVTQSDPGNPVIFAFPVCANGTTGKGRVFFIDTTQPTANFG